MACVQSQAGKAATKADIPADQPLGVSCTVQGEMIWLLFKNCLFGNACLLFVLCVCGGTCF